jgi:regulator of protease activity HflC (stomatin/prohibitin superfamily)
MGIVMIARRQTRSKLPLRFLLAVVVCFALLLSTVGCTRIGPGYVGIKVSNAGDSKGVQDYALTTGWVFYMPTATTVFEYPTFMQNAKWEGPEAIQFNSQEGMLVSVGMSIGYQLLAPKVPAFYVKFRNDNLEDFTHGYLRNIARDAFNEIAPNYHVDELYGPKKEEFLAKVKERINTKVQDLGVIVDQFGVLGAMQLPANVVAALNAKITATQDALRIENELRSAEAEAKKKIANAEGEARSNAILTSSLNDKLLEWKRMELQYHTIMRWNGTLPQVTGGQMPLLQLPAIK